MSRHNAGIAVLALLAAAGAAGAAGAAAAERPDAPLVKRAAEQFVARETAGLPGRISYTVAPLDPQLSLPLCQNVEVFLPAGGRLWGNANLGVRCIAPAAWTVYLPAEIHVWSGVVHASRPLVQGQPLTEADFAVEQADLTRLPSGVVTDVRAAAGKALIASLPQGQPLRADMLRAPTVIQQGQPVKLLVRGRGFSVTGEGRALMPATDGQLVQVRVQSGLVVSGLARPGATVEIGQ